MKTKRAAIYARVSTDENRQDPETQLRELRDFAERRGFEVVGEYIDHASGKTEERERYKRLLEDARRRRRDVGLVLFPATTVMLPTDAQAVVGRPATPGSVAGTARRSSRRTVRRHHRHHHHAAAVVVGATAAVAIGTRVATLPPSCTTIITAGVTYQQCGGTYYRPYYQGTEVVYVVVEAP